MDLSIIIVCLVALFLSAFFSGLEIAFTASNKLLLTIEDSNSRVFDYVKRVFRRSPSNFLSSILVGNTIALVVFSLFLASAFGYSILLEILVATAIVVVVAEFFPRVLVFSSPSFFLRAFVTPAFIFYILFYPVIALCAYISKCVLWVFGCKVKAGLLFKGFDVSDLQTLVEEEMASSTPLENEMRLLHNALDFSQVKVRDCMVPRVEIEAFDVEGSMDDLKKLFISTKFSRIPIYRESPDTIIGYASSRQLFDNPTSIEAMLREPLYVPSSASAQSLFEGFIRTSKSMAIVIDEFGATAGLVTSEDILEEIFGEIDDEHDADYFVGKEVAEGEYLLSGRASLDELAEEFAIEIERSEHYETLAGYLLYCLEDMPQVGAIYEAEGLRFEIERVTAQRISLIKVIKNV